MSKFQRGEKLIFIPENEIYDFGYYGQTGKAIIYNEGECNMQDSCAVDVEDFTCAEPEILPDNMNRTCGVYCNDRIIHIT